MTDQFAHDTARMDQLVLVDALDRPTGTASKEDAHHRGLLHRAFSVVLVRTVGTETELLLSQRAEGKYHSAGLWANSCCSHPRAGEGLLDAARRRTREELGVEADDLAEIASFVYRAAFANGLVEYEFDHVILGTCTGEPQPDPTEVQATRWIKATDLSRELVDEPESFAAWALTVLPIALRFGCAEGSKLA